jgi:hypothetical protein
VSRPCSPGVPAEGGYVNAPPVAGMAVGGLNPRRCSR